MNRILFITICTIFLACNRNSNQKGEFKTRDSILNTYIKATDTLAGLDTTDQDLKLLRAYQSGDNVYLKQYYKYVFQKLKGKSHYNQSILYNTLKPMNQLQFDEAYRFCYSMALCNKPIVFTLGKLNDTIYMDFIQYNLFNSKLKKEKHISKVVSPEIWKTLMNGIEFSDFWGLNEFNGKMGIDGSGMDVSGFIRKYQPNKSRFHQIWRWLPEKSAIGVLFQNLLDQTGCQVDCYLKY